MPDLSGFSGAEDAYLGSVKVRTSSSIAWIYSQDPPASRHSVASISQSCLLAVKEHVHNLAVTYVYLQTVSSVAILAHFHTTALHNPSGEHDCS